MARKKPNKTKVKPLEETHENVVPKVSSTSNIENKWKILLFIFGFLLYANTINFDYVLDDKIVINSNQITKKGFSGMFDHFKYDSMDGFWAEQYGISVEDLNKNALVAGGRYRPLSLVTYSIEWGIFGNNPGLSHIINAILYGLTGLVLLTFLVKLFPSSTQKPIWQSVPFWATLLFLAHPLHVEVVANIKSRDEMLSLLFGLLSLSYMIDYIKESNKNKLILGSAMLFLSLLSKETTIAFVALGPLMLYFFDIGKAKEWKTVFFGLLGAGILYTAIRFMVLGSPDAPIASELMNSPFLNATESERLATIFLILAAYAKLLFFPFPLTHDYYPYHLPFLPEEQHYATWSSMGAIIGVLLIIGLLVVIVRGFKSKSIYAFSALFFLGTSILISNLFFPIGVFMNERFMYIPSIGVVIAVVYFVLEVLPVKLKNVQSTALMGFLGMVVLVFTVMSIGRSAAWKSDYSLALTDVQISTGSAKINMSAADALLKDLNEVTNQEERTEIINEAYGYLKKSLDIYPEFFPPLDLLGKLYYESANYEESIKFYGYCADRKPGNKQFVDNIFLIGNKLTQELRFEEAVRAYDVALAYSPVEKKYLLAAAEVYAKNMQNPSRALPYMERAYKSFPNDADVAEKLGITYAMLQRYDDAIRILQPLLDQNPNDKSIMKNLGIAYYHGGQTEKGMALISKSEGKVGS